MIVADTVDAPCFREIEQTELIEVYAELYAFIGRKGVIVVLNDKIAELIDYRSLRISLFG